MKQIERRQWWTAVHRYSGLAIMIFLFIASVTGVALSFSTALDATLNPDLFVRAEARPIDPIAAAAGMAARRPDLVVTALPVHGEAYRTIPVGVGAASGGKPLGYDQLFLDTADGHVRGTRSTGPGWGRRNIMRGVFAFHYTLLAGDWGRWLMGVAAIAWFASNLVGVYLTLPMRGTFWKQWKRTWQVKPSSPLPRLLLDLHRASALWLLGGVTLLAFTSVCMNFFGEAFSPLVHAVSPGRPSMFDRPAPAVPPPAARIGVARALAIAAARSPWPDWRPAKLEFERDRGVYRILFTDTGVENYHGLGPTSLYVDGQTGRVVEVDDPYRNSAGQKLSRSLYPIHTGKIAGTLGIVIDVLCGIATIEMIVTGAYLWLKRRRRRVMARRAKRARALAQR